MKEQHSPDANLLTEKIALAPYRQVYQAAEEAFSSKKCFSLIRLGDGESAVLGHP